jgi:hypothetical protein
MGVCTGVYTGDCIDVYRAVRRAVRRDDRMAINHMDVCTANYRTFLVY